MKHQDYIWDLGGTLLDNYEISTQAFAETLIAFNLPHVSHDDIYSALKLSTVEAVTRFSHQRPGFLEAYKSNEADYLSHPILFSGARETLEGIVLAGGRNFLWSHRNRQVLDILVAAGIEHLFVEVVTSDNGFPRKPKPDALYYLKEKYGIDRGLVVGDRPIDIEAGLAAGCDTYFFDGKSDLREILELE